MEDDILEEYVEKVEKTDIYVKKYKVSDSGEERWIAEFIHNDAHYYIMTSDISKHELESILKNLYFF